MKLEGLLDTVLAVQAAWGAAGEPGYFFPRNTNAFLQLETNTQRCDPCVPYYIYHKSLAGLIDIAARLANERARAAAVGMGDWAVARVAKVLASGGQAVWQNVLNTEWGGMNDALNNLYRLTGDVKYLNTASAFNHWAWTAPLVVHDDELQSFHANTHIPEILGDLNGWALTQNATQEAIVRNFVDILFTNHSWATGGSNDHEWWGPPRKMLGQLNPDTEETCTQYNIAKVTSSLGTLDGDPAHFDWTERQLWNGMLGNQHIGGQWADTDSTGFHYMLPLGGSQLRKPWGDSSDGFPCCWGTSVEQFAGRHLELPFAEAPDHGTLYVNLFMPVTLTWAARANLTVAQAAGFPSSTTSTTRLTVGGGGGGPQTFTLALRVPSWARGANAVTLNGAPLPAPAPVPGAYLAVTRAWAAGDVLDAYFPLSLSWEPIADDSPDAAGVGAVLYGPILLAAVGARSDVAPNHDMSGGPGKWVTRVPDEAALRFSFAGPFGVCGSGDAPLDMIPLHDIKDENYTVYFRTGAAPPPAHWTGAPTSLPCNDNTMRFTGGASGGGTIRSGNPGEVNLAYFSTQIQDPVHAIVGASFTFQYNVGYGPAGRHKGSTLALALVEACAADPAKPAVTGVLYTSEELTAPAYDTCSSCYSAPVKVNVTLATPVHVTNLSALAFIFTDNDRNLNMPFPQAVTLYWA